MKNWRWGR